MEYDVLCTGMALVDSIIKGFNQSPISSTGYIAESGSLCPGGEAVNEAVTAAKLGLTTGILCALGDDSAGDLIVNTLKKSGVDISAVIRDHEHPTPVTTMFVNPDGTRKSITNKAHQYNFHPERYSELLKHTKAVTVGSLFRAPFNDPEIIFDFLKSAKSNGCEVFADTKLPNFDKLTLDDVRESLPLIDYIFPNEDEAKHYTGKSNPEEMADILLSYGIRNVVIKLGSKGCLMKNQEKKIVLEALPVNAVDATGAGDNFLAGFICEKLNGAADREALIFANACGAICTTEIGAISAIQDRKQVQKYLEKNNQ